MSKSTLEDLFIRLKIDMARVVFQFATDFRLYSKMGVPFEEYQSIVAHEKRVYKYKTLPLWNQLKQF